jgi:putative transposase
MPWGLERWHGGHDLHFLTFSCYRRQPLLASPRRRDLFAKVLETVRRRYQWVVIGYVVMPEHVHLLVSEPALRPLSTAIQALKLGFARRVLAEQRRHGGSPQADLPEQGARRIWQARYYDFNVCTPQKQVEKLRYLRRSRIFQRTANRVLTGCLTPGGKRTAILNQQLALCHATHRIYDNGPFHRTVQDSLCSQPTQIGDPVIVFRKHHEGRFARLQHWLDAWQHRQKARRQNQNVRSDLLQRIQQLFGGLWLTDDANVGCDRQHRLYPKLKKLLMVSHDNVDHRAIPPVQPKGLAQAGDCKVYGPRV